MRPSIKSKIFFDTVYALAQQETKEEEKMLLCEVPELQNLPYSDSNTTRSPMEMLYLSVTYLQE